MARRARLGIAAALIAALAGVILPAAARAATPEQTAMDAWQVQPVGVPTRDVAYVAQRDVLVATVAHDHPSLGNDLIEVDPRTGEIRRSVLLGSSPGRLAVSDDGTTAYVALEGANAIVRVDLVSFAVTQRFSTGADSDFGPVFVNDLAVAPGRDDVVVASLAYRARTPFQFGVYAFQDGVALPTHTSTYPDLGPQELVFADATTMYGSDNTDFYKLTLTSDGVTMTPPASILSGQHLKMADNLVATSSGLLLDPSGPTTVRNFGVEGRFAPDAAHDRITFASAVWPDRITFSQFRLSDGALLASRQFPSLDQQYQLRATADGFALATASALVLLGPNVLAGAVAIPAGPKPSVNSLGEITVPVYARHIVYDPLLSRVYATVGNDGSAFANDLVAIDSTTGAVVGVLPLLPDPDPLAISDDSTRLYVGMKAASTVVVVDAVTMVPLRQIDLGSVDNDAVFAADLAVRPGAADTVAVTLRWNDSSGNPGLVLYKDGELLPDTFYDSHYYPPSRVRFASSTKLYGSDNGAISAFDVTDSGVTETAFTYTYFYGLQSIFGATAWSPGGYAYDPASPTELLGSLGLDGRVNVQPDRNRAYVLNDFTESLTEFDLATFRPIGSRRVVRPGYRGEFVQTANGFAATADGGVLLLNPAFCGTKLATLTTSGGTATGTPGDDVIVGGPGDDVIDGGGGNDVICGLGGNDTINGGAGNDTILGGDGNDTLRGGDGNDRIFGGAGADDIDGGTGLDAVYLGNDATDHTVTLDGVANDGVAGEGDNIRSTNEMIVGSPGNDIIVGDDGPQMLYGQGGDDVLAGLGGNDLVDGGAGNDRLFGGFGTNKLTGGDGVDSCVERSATDLLRGCEQVVRR